MEAARRRAPAARVVCADVRELPYGSGTFDAVLLLTLLSSLANETDVQNVLAEVSRVLAPGGVVVVWEPRIPNPFNRHTIHVSLDMLRSALGTELHRRTLTLLPPLARRLGHRTKLLYPSLVRVPLLRSHWLVWCRSCPGRKPARVSYL